MDKAQSRSRVLAVLIAIIALAFGGFIEMWLWAGAGFLAVGVGLITGGGAGAIFVAVGIVLFIVGLVRLVLAYPRRRRSAKARLADVDIPTRRGH